MFRVVRHTMVHFSSYNELSYEFIIRTCIVGLVLLNRNVEFKESELNTRTTENCFRCITNDTTKTLLKSLNQLLIILTAVSSRDFHSCAFQRPHTYMNMIDYLRSGCVQDHVTSLHFGK